MAATKKSAPKKKAKKATAKKVAKKKSPAKKAYCFPAGTEIEMSDGSSKLISEVHVGDHVRSWDAAYGCLADGLVVFVINGTVDRLISLNMRLMASPAHRILTLRGYVRFDKIRVGDQLFSLPALRREAVCQVDVLRGSFQVVNLVVKQFASFFAEGLLVEDQVGAQRQRLSAGQGSRNYYGAVRPDPQSPNIPQAFERRPSLHQSRGTMSV